LNLSEFADSVFKLDKKIRRVVVVDRAHHVLLQRPREGIKPILSEEDVHRYSTIVPEIMMEGAEKLEPVGGRIHGIAIRYDKFVVYFFKSGSHIVSISCEPDMVTPFITEMGTSVQEIWNRLDVRQHDHNENDRSGANVE